MGMGTRELMAKRAAEEIRNGDVVNLGIGIPTLIPDFLSDELQVFFHSENGLLGIGPRPAKGKEDPHIINAGGRPCSAVKGASYFDSAESFAIIRSGKLDVTVLGALEIDENGNLANWIIPGKMVPGMGGGMDLAVKSRKVVVLMTHTDKKGNAKIKKQCSLPLTASACVDLIITDLAVIEVAQDGLVLKEVFDYTSIEEVMSRTEAMLKVGDDIKIISTNISVE
jgi:acetate CoA/acetoacetate CoA-transferase beta subunit